MLSPNLASGDGTGRVCFDLVCYPAQTLADSGYRSEAVFEALAKRADPVVTIGREGQGHRAIDDATLPLPCGRSHKW